MNSGLHGMLNMSVNENSGSRVAAIKAHTPHLGGCWKCAAGTPDESCCHALSQHIMNIIY